MKQDELMHYGRKGMKWGQHIFGKNKKVGGTPPKSTEQKAKKAISEAGKQSVKTKKVKSTSKSQKPKTRTRTVKDMSDAELEAYVTRVEKRMNLEKRYAAIHPEEVSKGRKFIKDLQLRDKVLIPTLTNVANAQGTKILNEIASDYVTNPLLKNLKKK